MPKISIIVPNYNYSQFLEERLESILNQTFQDFEVILLDDRSTDNSVEILNKYANNPKVVHYKVNKGNSGSPFKQWEKGIKLAKGSFLWIAEADDFCDSDFLEETINPLLNNSDISLSYCQSSRMNSEGQVTGNWITHTQQFSKNIFSSNFIMPGNEFIEKFLIHKNVIPNVSAVLFRKSHLDRILPLSNEPFQKYNADWYYYMQLLCNTKVAFISKTLNHFRYHGDSVISRAGHESGWLKIYRMELKGRKKMLSYLKGCQPENLKQIKIQAKFKNDELKYLIAASFLKRNKYLSRSFKNLFKPILLKLKTSFDKF